MNSIGQARPKAEGFPLAPLIEALLDVRFEQPLSDDEVEAAKEALEPYYPTSTPVPFHDIRISADDGSVQLADTRKHYRGQGVDTSEVSLLRPDGIATSQLAPYRDWPDLYARFSRDLHAVFDAVGHRAISRMAVRSINRIDVPPTGDLFRYEDYLRLYPLVPEDLDPINDFQVQILKSVPEVDGTVRIVARGHPAAVEGKASFVLDVDLFRTSNVPTLGHDFDAIFEQFREVKNRIYRACLTPLALEEFEQ